jgi:hypothetical protein
MPEWHYCPSRAIRRSIICQYSGNHLKIILPLAKHRIGAANRRGSTWPGHEVIAMLNGKVEWCDLIMFG